MTEYNSTKQIQLLTGDEVAKILRISRAYAYRLMQQGIIPTVRLGRSVRVSYESLSLFIRENSRQHQLDH